MQDAYLVQLKAIWYFLGKMEQNVHAIIITMKVMLSSAFSITLALLLGLNDLELFLETCRKF